MYSAVLLLGLIAVDVTDDPLIVKDRVDIIELNYCLDHRGKLAFRQLIFFEWSAYHRRFQIRDAVVVMSDDMLPQKNVATGKYCTRWLDGGMLREVQSASFRVSKTTMDPEVPERKYLPIHLRKKLTEIRGSNLERSASETPIQIRTATRIKPIPLIKD